ncbi:MAG: DUF1553 domain-containing protein [Planctomycetes bacterium]|nr:DUF1553 domain-containing protein [Planctomycetota bacterium]MCB9918439.1 DUF1553 domain-containing protein [Planctomycetota bacterium]
MIPRVLSIGWASCVCATILTAQAVSFVRDVKPILSDKCFVCHGPDASTREANLRLDGRATAARVLDGNEPELVRRIDATDGDERMPPPRSHMELTEREREILRTWVREGARYAKHWSFVPVPSSVPVPAATVGESASTWARSSIDHFVLRAMRDHDLEPSVESERWRWLRRVTFDLIGLPPTLGEVRAFEADESDGAYERVVDRLLASPHYGEHRAVAWLDVARYADSYGYQSDLLMPTWPYRDLVVRAFNDGVPWDRFVRDQIAGDLAEQPTRDQRLATAFQRLHRMTNEGGSIPLEMRTEYVADRVRTFGTAFLGLTLECARCHDHKFDPISQREYYALSGFFNSIDEHGLYHDSSRVPTPSLLLPNERQEARLAELEIAMHDARSKLREAIAAASARVPVNLTDSDADRMRESALHERLAGWYRLDAIDAGKLANEVEGRKPGSTAPGNRLVDGKQGKALEFSGDDVASFPEVCGALRQSEPFTIAFWYRYAGQRDRAILLHRTSGTDVGFFGTELEIDRGRLRFSMQRHAPGNAMSVVTKEVLPKGEWMHVAIANDGSHGASALRIHVGGRLASTALRDTLFKNPGAGGSGFDFGQRFRDVGPTGDAVDEVRAYERALAPIEIAVLAETFDEGAKDRAAWTPWFVERDTAVIAAREALVMAGKAAFDHRTGFREISVMQETATPEATYVLARGAYDAPRDESTLVSRSTPACLPPLDEEGVTNRASLARWLTNPDHPLFARVTVNRLWQEFFGRGLVATADDFGSQGALPSHPDLLDWLARDFVTSGYDIKRLCRQIVLSSTYRQSSRAPTSVCERDPDNLWLARYPARRLTAEQLRDAALACSGLLDRSMGGPPVSPYQPKGLWRESNSMSPAYHQSVGTALYRRSLYSVWKRTAPLPNMLVFDAAHRESCVVKRGETSTPLQALVLLGDVQFVEAARVFAQRLLEGRDDDEFVRAAFLTVSSRPPSASEHERLVRLMRAQHAQFVEDEASANDLLHVGDAPAPAPADGDAPRVAAATMVAQVLFNLDAGTWKR